jgi:hypothetical protein
MLSRKLRTYIPLPYIFNVKNTNQLMNDFLEFPHDQDLKFVSFDITNMHSNVSTNEFVKAIDLMCTQHNIKEELKHEIKKISQIIINKFHVQDTLYLQEEGLNVGAPTLSIFYKIYIKHV